MATGLRHSTIETFRRRYHGSATLRVCALNDDGDSLTILRTLTAGFYVGSNVDVTEGAAPYLVTIDRRYNPSLTDAEIRRAAFVELVSGSARRFRLDSADTPLIGDDRCVFGAHPAYNDAKTAS